MMERINYLGILDKIKEEAKLAPPGILPKGKSMDNYIGHTVINLSDVTLTTTQKQVLEKGLTFCPTPGPPDKSKIWTDFKEFHRRLGLKYHFHKDNGHFDHLSTEEAELIGFLAANLDEGENPYKDLHSQFKNKSTWKPPNIHQSLDIFSRALQTRPP